MADLKIKMTIGENGSAFYTTSLIKGELKAILLDSNEPVSRLSCVFDNYPAITILELNNVIGNHYYPVGVPNVDVNGNPYNYSSESYVLNDKLSFNIMGKAGTVVEIVVRYV